METVERIHRSFFSAEEKSMVLKNIGLRRELQKVLARSKELIFSELYATTSTFGILVTKQHDALASLIEGELPNMDWYEANKHDSVALAIPGYIVGFALFNYALPKPDRELLAFYYTVFEPNLFAALGFTPPYFNTQTGVFDQKAVKKGIKDIVERSLEKYPKLAPDYGSLDFKTPAKFARSYLLMLKNLDFQTKEK